MGSASGLQASRLKLSSLVQQGLKLELEALTATEVRILFNAYALKYGAMPTESAEPTGDQVSALKQLLVSDRPPYVDFALWGPFGRRMLQKLVFITMVLGPGGEWLRKELPGPPGWNS